MSREEMREIKSSLSPRIKNKRVLPQHTQCATYAEESNVNAVKNTKNGSNGIADVLPKKTAKLLRTAATATDENVIFGASDTSGNNSVNDTEIAKTTERVAFRQAISGLYSLASKLHTSDNHTFLAKHLQTLEKLRERQSSDKSQQLELLSSDQVWGQLSLFGNPIINCIGRNLSRLNTIATNSRTVNSEQSKDLRKNAKKKIAVLDNVKMTKGSRHDNLEIDEEDFDEEDSESDEESESNQEEDIDPVVAKVLKKEEETKRRNQERKLAARKEKELLGTDMDDAEDGSDNDLMMLGDAEEDVQRNKNKKGRKHKDVLKEMNSDVDDDDANIDDDNEAVLDVLLQKQKKAKQNKNKQEPLNGNSDDDGDDDDDDDREFEDEEEDEFDEDAMAALYGDEYEDDEGDGDESDRDDDKLMGEMDEDFDAAVEDMEEALYDDVAELEGYEKGLFHEDGDILQDGYGDNVSNGYGDNMVGFGDDPGTENDLGLDQYGMSSSNKRHNNNNAVGEEEESFVDENGKVLTAYERKCRRQAKEIEDIEMKRIYNTDWTMKGEVDARSRPKDSLLTDVHELDFEHGMKAVPVITEAHTAKLEERIKMRIRDSNFNDVERRIAVSSAADLTADTHKKITQAGLDATKSKVSLVDLYEKDYVERMKRAEAAAVGAGDEPESAEPMTEIEKDELRAIQMWKRLSQHLDALSNYHFTPKPVREDLDVRVRAVENQAPAISLESVGLSALPSKGTSSALAPQDTYRPSKKAMIGNVSLEEMDTKERRALRQAKKATSASTRARIERKKAEKELAKKKKV